MAMGPPTIAGIAITAVNSVLLAALAVVWFRNYQQFRSTMVLGLLAFSVVWLIENLVAIAFFFSSMAMLYSTDPLVGQVVLGMRILELIAVGFLAYVTLK
ncbi:hypothetical protein [Halovenus sp. HT40]|uniref:hypothetical protein n=1 Tax=Halovenus sp. HT40 TaxID=3126691 RepID=UPI00300ED8D4